MRGSTLRMWQQRSVSSSTTSTSRSSSETMCTSTEDCFCQEQLRQNRSPNSSWAQRRRSSAESASSSVSVRDSCRLLLSEKHLLQGVSAEPEPQGLERDHLFGRDVPQVDLGTEPANEPGLRGLGRSLEDDVARLDPVDDLVDQAGANLAGGAEDAGGAG